MVWNISDSELDIPTFITAESAIGRNIDDVMLVSIVRLFMLYALFFSEICVKFLTLTYMYEGHARSNLMVQLDAPYTFITTY